MTSPERQKRKLCEACGQEFFCSVMAAGCWCEEIRLTPAARREIARRCHDCLCRSCLELRATKEENGKSKDNALA
jgi:hypothetical protein